MRDRTGCSVTLIPLLTTWLVAGPSRAADPVRPPIPASSDGNNLEARATSRSCLTFLKNYLPPDAPCRDARIYLKLVADPGAELTLSKDPDRKGYRENVQIAYLLIWVPAVGWIHSSAEIRHQLASMHFSMLRSLYPGASLFISVFDGQDAVAHGNWKKTDQQPRLEVL